MQRYFAKDESLTLNDSDYHHIKKVMRMKTGDVYEVVYDNVVYKCKITDNDFSYEILEKYKVESSKREIIIAFSLLKEQKLDYVLQKGTETGASSFIPLITKRSVIKFDKGKEISKLKRWNTIAKEASEQCFRPDIPEIKNVMTIDELINVSADLKILLTLNEKSKNIKKVLQKNNKCDKIIIVIGPEGGFEDVEEKKLIENGFVSVTLGKNVLRAETAPIVALSMINYEFMR